MNERNENGNERDVKLEQNEEISQESIEVMHKKSPDRTLKAFKIYDPWKFLFDVVP